MPDLSPNLLYLHCHDAGRHLGPYGYPVPTPNLGRLARGGVTFRNAFCVSPTCSPARAGLLTGQYPHQCGQFGLSNRGFPLEHLERHVARTLGDAGYRTALVGVQHVARTETDLPYGHVAPEIVGYALGEAEEAATAASVAGRAVDWLEAHGRAGPWFLDAGTLETHAGTWKLLDEAELATDPTARPPAVVPDGPEARSYYSRHIAMARRLDDAVGRILERLDALGLAENTLVVFTTDHGLGVPTAKCNLTDAGLEVALLMRGPGLPAAAHVEAVVSHLDVFPTLLGLAGVERPAWYEGRSLLPAARGLAGRVHEATFGEMNWHGGPQPARSVRTDRFKLIRRWHDADALAYNTDARPVRQPMLDAGWPHRLPPGREAGAARDVLFDLALDPTERCDRSGDPAYDAAYHDLAGRLARWMRDTHDPLLGGVAALPEPRPF